MSHPRVEPRHLLHPSNNPDVPLGAGTKEVAAAGRLNNPVALGAGATEVAAAGRFRVQERFFWLLNVANAAASKAAKLSQSAVSSEDSSCSGLVNPWA